MKQNIKFDLTTAQRNFLQSKKRGNIFVSGIGSGKSWCLCIKAIANALKGRRELICTFDYNNIRDVIVATMLELLRDKFDAKEDKDFTYNKSDHIFDFSKVGGNEVILRSSDKPEKLRGLNLHDFFLDEARNFAGDRKKEGSDHAFDVLLGRIRKTEDAQWFIGTTTKGKDWVYDLWKHGYSEVIQNNCFETEDLLVVRQRTVDNPFLPKSYIEDLKKRYSTLRQKQELDGDIVEFNAGVIDPNWFKTTYDKNENRRAVRFWDLAFSTRKKADFTVGTMAYWDDDKFVIHHQKKFKKSWPETRQTIIDTAIGDGTDTVVAIEQAGQQQGYIDEIARDNRLRPFTVKGIKPVGNKFERAMPWIAKAECGIVYLIEDRITDSIKNNWIKEFLDECASFTEDDSHLHDDCIDSVSGAYHFLTKPPTEIKSTKQFNFD